MACLHGQAATPDVIALLVAYGFNAQIILPFSINCNNLEIELCAAG